METSLAIDPPLVAIVMGVSGVGKTTVATALAGHMGWPFQEGDALHPPANLAKMKAGQPLTDEDRIPWLDQIRAWIDAQLEQNRSGVITCSALKRSYRERLRAGRTNIVIVFIEADHDLIARRIGARTGHFMPPSLLDSQFAALEPPTREERPITVSASDGLDEQVREIARALQERSARLAAG